jgi:hypothetical protein
LDLINFSFRDFFMFFLHPFHLFTIKQSKLNLGFQDYWKRSFLFYT